MVFFLLTRICCQTAKAIYCHHSALMTIIHTYIRTYVRAYIHWWCQPGHRALRTSGIAPRGAGRRGGVGNPRPRSPPVPPIGPPPRPPPQNGAAGGMREPEPMGDQWVSQRGAQPRTRGHQGRPGPNPPISRNPRSYFPARAVGPAGI